MFSLDIHLPPFIFLSLSHRFAAIQACEQQLLQFRSLSGSLLRWLQAAQDQLPGKEASLTTEGLQRRVQQLKVWACGGFCSSICVEKKDFKIHSRLTVNFSQGFVERLGTTAAKGSGAAQNGFRTGVTHHRHHCPTDKIW